MNALSESLGVFLLVAFVFVVAGLVAYSRIPRALKYVLWAGLALRVLGAIARHTILMDVYGGVGDAVGYYHTGLRYAATLAEFDLSPLTDPSTWRNGRWWGTQFVYYPATLVAAVVGPSLLGGFIAFSLLAGVGIAGFLVAFRRSFPDVPLHQYAVWILLFPSMWFWPSSVGKEALILMGLGIAAAGFIGRRDRVNWFLLIPGISLVFAIRPQMAAVLLLSLIMAHWAGAIARWDFVRVSQALLILVVGLVGIRASMVTVGVDGFDIEGVQEYVETSAARRVGGGSAIEAVSVGWSGLPLALVNVLARPFPWEAHNAMALLSSVEMLCFWTLVVVRRKALATTLRNWRSNRLLRFSIPFILMYSLALGLMVSNLGIISRQRVLVLPFLMVAMSAVPWSRTGRRLASTDPGGVPLEESRARVRMMEPAAP